ncbi:MAG: zinc-ribbon domain-containing protein, partial [Myxococcota bacterium]
MIVTCESCKSRYKLDDAKITGRGAKITCPKCKNVFVVYAKDPNEVARSAGTPPAPPRDTTGAPKPVERKDAPGRVVAGAAAPPQTEEAWDDEPTRVGENLPVDGGHEIVRPKPPASLAWPAAPAPTAATPAPAPAAAAPAAKPTAERAPGE